MLERAAQDDRLDALQRVGERTRGLALLVLFGSRARADATERSDWDVGFMGEVDAEQLRVELTRAVGTDSVDVVDLARAGALLRFRAARDGRALVEATPGAFDAFRERAALFWCDVEPVLRDAYDGVLAGLDR